jgi:hypothetical protein
MDYVEYFLAGEENTSNSAARQYKVGFPHEPPNPGVG